MLLEERERTGERQLAEADQDDVRQQHGPGRHQQGMKACDAPAFEVNIYRKCNRQQSRQQQGQDYFSGQRFALLSIAIQQQLEDPVGAQLRRNLEDEAETNHYQERNNKRNRESVSGQCSLTPRFRVFKRIHQSLRGQDQAESANGGQNQALRLAAQQGSAHKPKAASLEWSAQHQAIQ